MDYICGMTFAPFVPGTALCSKEAKESFLKMIECTSANFVIFVPTGLQDNACSETIVTGKESVTEDQLREMILFAKEQGIRVAVKPTVNCKDGTWRAHIHFFDEEVPCEPKWSKWFESYTEFQLRYAKVAEETGCEMFIPGCEMVMSEHREAEWRKLIADIREVYHGLISYNTDKYREPFVTWWDAVDVISSSGYYPIGDWEKELDRIEPVVKKYNKPFFFAEAGCMSTKGSNLVPNDWTIQGESDTEGQRDWYKAMFEVCEKRPWVGGFALWDWKDRLYCEREIEKKRFYDIYLKPAQEVVREYYDKHRR